MNKKQIAGIFQPNNELLVMAVNGTFLPPYTRPDGGWEFTREWVTKSA
jgi:hypothetical protein